MVAQHRLAMFARTGRGKYRYCGCGCGQSVDSCGCGNHKHDIEAKMCSEHNRHNQGEGEQMEDGYEADADGEGEIEGCNRHGRLEESHGERQVFDKQFNEQANIDEEMHAYIEAIRQKLNLRGSKHDGLGHENEFDGEEEDNTYSYDDPDVEDFLEDAIVAPNGGSWADQPIECIADDVDNDCTSSSEDESDSDKSEDELRDDSAPGSDSSSDSE